MGLDLYIPYNFLLKLNIFHDFFYRKKIEQNCAYIAKNKKKVLKKLRNKDVLKVVFYVYDSSKWKCQTIYDEMCHIITDYENPAFKDVTAKDLYRLLVKIQNNWETITTGIDSDAVKTAINTGLNIRFSGSYNSESRVSMQSLTPGSTVKRGSVITLRTISTDFED